jgi:hypothetical protein
VADQGIEIPRGKKLEIRTEEESPAPSGTQTAGHPFTEEALPALELRLVFKTKAVPEHALAPKC